MYNSSNIANEIRFLANKNGIKINKMLLDIGLGRNTMSHLDNGSMLKADTLAKIADYLGVSVDYLLGRTTEMNVALTEEEINLLETYKQSPSPKLVLEINKMMKHKSPKQLEAIATILEQD